MGWLTFFRKKAGLTQARLATLAKTKQPTIVKLEKGGSVEGGRKLTKEWAQRLSPFLNCTPEDLVFGVRTCPIRGYVGAGSEAHFYEQGDETVLGQALLPPGGSERTIAVEVRGISLGPAFNGWLVYYDERRDPPTDDLLGELCVVWLESGQVLVKTMVRGRIAGHYDLHDNQGGYLSDQAVKWAARVIWFGPPTTAKVVVEPQQSPLDEAEIPLSRPRTRRRKK